jgi:hypothetical protein
MDFETTANRSAAMSACRSENVRTRAGFSAKNLIDVRRSEGTHTQPFTASLRRAHDIAGDPDNAVLLAE